ncbi:6774_t:CDS:2 [Paraglomus occultum]|uniref:6774_t:CDS:1 n=1 Tax=Paraglomus occultum TaxID=144539 RepID=A0A9N8VJC8_9GLOM|nr:6774_t:CDS:2 [Paraglomus occultum]
MTTTKVPPHLESKITFQFTIRNVSQLSGEVFSPPFASSYGSDRFEYNRASSPLFWQLSFGVNKKSPEYCYVRLIAIPNAHEKVIQTLAARRKHVTARLFLKASQSSALYLAQQRVSPHKLNRRVLDRTAPKFWKRVTVAKDKVIVGCVLDHAEIQSAKYATLLPDKPTPRSLLAVWGSYLNNPSKSDILFRARGGSLYAESRILSARSPYFRAMFNGQWAETKMKSIESQMEEAICSDIEKGEENQRGNNEMDGMEDTGEGIGKQDAQEKKQGEDISEKRKSKKNEGEERMDGDDSSMEESEFSDEDLSLFDKAKEQPMEVKEEEMDDVEAVTEDKVGSMGNQFGTSNRPVSFASTSGIQNDACSIKSRLSYLSSIPSKALPALSSPSSSTSSSSSSVSSPLPLPTKTSQYHVIDLPDVAYPTLNALLLYLYIDLIHFDADPKSSISALAIYTLADQYCISDLSELAKASILENLSPENVAEMLFGSGYLYPELKGPLLEYIIRNFNDVKKSEGFKHVLDHPEEYENYAEVIKEIFAGLEAPKTES